MGNSEAVTPPKSSKSSSPVQSQEQLANPPYPEWAAMQAYYGPRMMPSPYFSTAFAPGHPPHPYIWSPQPLIPPPFGSPYTAIYPHGGVYSHPSVPLNSHAHCGITPSTTANETVLMETPLSIETPAKSSKDKDKKLVKKLKGLDGIAVSGGNSITDNKDQAAGGNSGYNSTEDSSDGSDGGNAEGVSNSQSKRRSDDIASSENAKISEQVNPGHSEETDTNSKAAAGVTGATAIPAKPVGTLPSSAPALGMGIKVSNASKVKAIGTPVPLATTAISGQNGVPSELWLQDDREIKRERRKLSNRESARRSRLRKQAETEELSQKVESLVAENSNLRTEISCLTENSAKLKLENSALMAVSVPVPGKGYPDLVITESHVDAGTSQLFKEELKIVQPSDHGNMNNVRIAPVVAENFLSMIENQGSISRPTQREGDANDKSTKKLRQLRNSSPRRDAVAAS